MFGMLSLLGFICLLYFSYALTGLWGDLQCGVCPQSCYVAIVNVFVCVSCTF